MVPLRPLQLVNTLRHLRLNLRESPDVRLSPPQLPPEDLFFFTEGRVVSLQSVAFLGNVGVMWAL